VLHVTKALAEAGVLSLNHLDLNLHSWIDGHHIIHWSDGGPTELDNLVSLCRPHHRAVHEQGWRIRIDDGLAVVEPPP
jgi:predicted restriction endonuclease